MAKHKTPSAEHAHDDHRPNVKLYIAVFAALMVLTLVTVLISKFHLPRPQAIALGLLVATIKASLVGAIFMHLWGENKLISRILLVCAGFSVMLILPMIDFHLLTPRQLTRVDVALQHPAEGGEAPEAAKEAPAPAAEAPKAPAKAAPAKPAKKAAKAGKK